VKAQQPSAKKGLFAQDAFAIDTAKRTVTCPSARLVELRPPKAGSGVAESGKNRAACPLRAQCTDSIGGRTVRTHAKHDTLDRSRRAQRDPAWKQRCRSIRPKVERKLAHIALLAAAINLARLAVIAART
jgi:hypothetical protein